MPYVDSDGWQVWYEATGSGPPLVCSGGPLMMHDQFARVTAPLARHFTVVNWNWRGAGNSGRNWVGGITIDHLAQDLRRVLAALGIERAAFWGASTGAALSIRYAALFPDAVERMVLFPTWRIPPYDAQGVYAKIAERSGVEGIIWMAYWVATSEEAIQSGEVVRMALEEMEVARRNTPPDVAQRVSRVLSDIDLTGDVAKLRMPVLLLVGGSGRNGASAPHVARAITDFRELAPGAELAVIPRAGGTLPMLEQPEATVEALLRFLRP
jgi:pimeloyl-ACP methyl ester carboxylesterase